MNKILHYFGWAAALLCGISASTLQAQNCTPQVGDAITTDDGKYIVKGTNLITNPSFDNGLSDWNGGDGNALSTEFFEVVATGGADEGAFLKANGGAGSSSNKSIKTGWAIEIGKTYLFSCWAKRTANGMSSNTQYSRVYQASSATGTDTQVGTLNYVADTWVQTQIVFTAEKEYCVGGFGWLNSATSLDCFYLGVVELSNELVTEKLQTLIAEATDLLSTTTEGTEQGQYTTEVRTALQSAITTAEGILSSATTQAEINNSYTVLTGAITTYRNSVNPPFTLGVKYNIVHRASDLLLTSAGNTGKTITIASDAISNNQVFTFEKAPEGAAAAGYNLKDADGNYVYRSGSWETLSGTPDLTTANAIFNVVEDSDYVQIKNMGSGSVLGTDGTSEGSAVYSNKNGAGAAKLDWTLKVFIPESERDAEFNFNQQLSKALKQLEAVDPSTCGTLPFAHSLAAYNTFSEAIETAKGMTDFSAATEYLKEAMQAFAENGINRPDESKTYSIVQSSGMSLTHFADDNVARIGSQTGLENQQYTFVAVNGSTAYFIKNVSTGYYLCKSSSSAWDTNWSEDNSAAESQWYISPSSNGYYSLQNVAGKGCLGSDATTESSAVYSDKSSSAVNSQWAISVFSLTAAVERQIVIAEELSTTVSVGSNYDQVPQEAMDALLAAIADAKAALTTISTFEEASAQALELVDAIALFKTSYNPMGALDTSKVYNLLHYSGNTLTVTSSGNATITTLSETEAAALQEITLISVPCDTLEMLYQVKAAGSNLYLAATGTYNSVWQERNDTLSTVFQVVQLQGKYFGLKCMASGHFMGTDDVYSGVSVYSDKVGTGNTNAYWYLENSVRVTVDKTVLDSTLQVADSLSGTMKQGYKAGEYFLSDIQAFATLIQQDRNYYNNSNEQVVIDSVNAQLALDILAYKAKAHATDTSIADYMNDLLPIYQAECDAAVIGTQLGNYTEASQQTYNAALEAARNSEKDELALQVLLDARATFLDSAIRVNRNALNSTITSAKSTLTAAVAGDCNGQYPAEAISTYQNAIDAADVAYADMNLTQEQVDAARQTLADAGTAFAATKIVINFTELKAAIAAANAAIANATPEKGEGPGTYPESAFTTLQALIDAAQQTNGSNSVNQTLVNAQATALYNAVEIFEASRVPNDYSQLETLLAEADSLYENVPVGTGAGMVSSDARESLKASIDKNRAALESTSQADINKAVKLLTRDLTLFKSKIVTGIENRPMEGITISCKDGLLQLQGLPAQATIQLYSVSGQLLDHYSQVTTIEKTLSEGCYLVVVEVNGNRLVRKVCSAR